MTEQIFWQLIEQAWADIATKPAAKRMKIAQKKGEKEPSELAEELQEVLEAEVVPHLETLLADLDAPSLLAFDRILEQKLHALDRTEIHAYTDGSNDGFLYCRGFIVGMGQTYYEAILQEPARATFDLEAEAMCYLSQNLYEAHFGEMPPSGISRETGGNPKSPVFRG